MCGIAGILNLQEATPIEESLLRRMLGAIRHRGPDQFGIYLEAQVALGSARLSIIDLGGGQQPITNEDGTLWIVFNGEIFNFKELRSDLEAQGHRFVTETDTEVILHLYEEHGPNCLKRLNGQFAIAIWDTKKQQLFLARDRLGVRPLFYTKPNGSFIFGSEIKALLADSRVRAEIDPCALEQIFTFWSTLSPRTVFKGISEVPPGHYLLVGTDHFEIQRYWQLEFTPPDSSSTRSPADYLDEFRSLLLDATRIRLRADVPIGAYLSGGLDSSTLAAIIRQNHTRLNTFSIAFSDPQFDESHYQRQMAQFLGTDHQVAYTTQADIGHVFPEVIWHTESPLMRTSPAPMFLLSKLVRDHSFKVVLTGEGADELLAGYDIFKEAKVRAFWARQPKSTLRPLLLKRLYPDIEGLSRNNSSYLEAFFRDGLTETQAPEYSHAIRWRNNRRTCRFFSEDLLAHGVSPLAAIEYPAQYSRWGRLERAQYLESTIFLSQYLLSSQGDRVGMAHSIEGRFPFLDCRLVEFCSRLPANLKLRGLTEKYLLKQLGRELLPPQIWNRPKRPYRAPIHRSFFNDSKPAYVEELLSPEAIRSTGFFKPTAVTQMVGKIRKGLPIGETDDMALAGIISTQLLHHQFVSKLQLPTPLSSQDDVKVCRGEELATAH